MFPTLPSFPLISHVVLPTPFSYVGQRTTFSLSAALTSRMPGSHYSVDNSLQSIIDSTIRHKTELQSH